MVDAAVTCEDGFPKFTCTFAGQYGATRSATIYLDEHVTRKAALRKLSEGIDSKHRRIVERIVDDLFDRFGAQGYLEYDVEQADRCNVEWSIRMLRKDLRRRGVPGTIARERVERVLDELYVIEPVLQS